MKLTYKKKRQNPSGRTERAEKISGGTKIAIDSGDAAAHIMM